MPQRSVNVDRNLDVREIDGEPSGDVPSALDNLAPDESLPLVNSFELLYEVLVRAGSPSRPRTRRRTSGTSGSPTPGWQSAIADAGPSRPEVVP